ncbi:patatin-like phospholipase family protein [Clostridium peptidivorans]|uniref:patatin-like phospholipase family protein n=1 Tax=Clostridium peptidivorans TaxID=100174 RepID=UPI000BE47B67|nr:patatin-like phospholipase family protein [Clostridium peptidivorans]
MNTDLVFEGGGVKAISYVGVLKALEEKNYKILRCAGTSAGAIISALIVAGYNSKELKDIVYNTDFKLFNKNTMVGNIPIIGGFISLLVNNGKYDGSVIEQWMDTLLKKKGITKFKDVIVNGKSILKVIVADITKRKMIILPDDLPEYGLDPLEFSIARAVRMSCSIPFYFTPAKLEYSNSISYIVDGGLLSNFPIWIFDSDNTNYPTIGIKIKDLDSYTSQGKTGILCFLKDVIDAPINVDPENFVRNKDKLRILIIDYGAKIKASDFRKIDKYIDPLIKNGYDQTLSFLKVRCRLNS